MQEMYTVEKSLGMGCSIAINKTVGLLEGRLDGIWRRYAKSYDVIQIYSLIMSQVVASWYGR